MIAVVLIGALALTVGGCVCVVWADRGGPRWARTVATATLTAGELVRRAGRKRRRSIRNSSGDSD